ILIANELHRYLERSSLSQKQRSQLIDTIMKRLRGPDSVLDNEEQAKFGEIVERLITYFRQENGGRDPLHYPAFMDFMRKNEYITNEESQFFNDPVVEMRSELRFLPHDTDYLNYPVIDLNSIEAYSIKKGDLLAIPQPK